MPFYGYSSYTNVQSVTYLKYIGFTHYFVPDITTHDLILITGTPVRIKRLIVESHEMVFRWQEELVVLKEEMTNFIKFYLLLIAIIREKMEKVEMMADGGLTLCQSHTNYETIYDYCSHLIFYYFYYYYY